VYAATTVTHYSLATATRAAVIVLAALLAIPAAAWADGPSWIFAAGQDRSAALSPGNARPAAGGAAAPDPAPTAHSGSAEPSPEERPPADPFTELPYGYPRRHDALFDHGLRLPYERQHLEKPLYRRPSYAAAMPQYVKPSYGQDPIKKPVYSKPLLTLPLDNKPHYDLRYPVPPPVIKPSYERPSYTQRPNYVYQPLDKPPVNRPGYDRSAIHYDRPEYRPPTYTPQPYKPPRYAPPPYIAPPN
jgi:hypothetical protein